MPEPKQWTSITDQAGQAGVVDSNSPASVSCVTDFYRRYPGELITLSVRVALRQPLSDLTLRVSVPRPLRLEHYHQARGRQKGAIPHTEVTKEEQILVWFLGGDLAAGITYDYQIEARVAQVKEDKVFECWVMLLGPDQQLIGETNLAIAVSIRANYLQYLPAFYEEDELLSRFLMLFESFWAPLERQIDNLHYHLDPGLTPAHLLGWLASWLDLELDENWSEAQLRALLRQAMKLHRSRGTRWGIQKYLEIYTGQWAEITEHRFQDFVLNPSARLDFGIALGPGNLPHTFTVTLPLPPIDAADEAERTRLEQLRRQGIEAIIERQKPAQAVYTLKLETLPPDKEGKDRNKAL